MQNDFITGSLALKNSPAGEDAAEIIPAINDILVRFGESFEVVVYTQDCHPVGHCSFVESVKRLDLDPSNQVSFPWALKMVKKIGEKKWKKSVIILSGLLFSSI